MKEVATFLDCTNVGSTFVCGHLANPDMMTTPFALADGSEFHLWPPFCMSILSVIIIFSAFVSLLNHIGVVGHLVKRIGVSLVAMKGTMGSHTQLRHQQNPL